MHKPHPAAFLHAGKMCLLLSLRTEAALRGAGWAAAPGLRNYEIPKYVSNT